MDLYNSEHPFRDRRIAFNILEDAKEYLRLQWVQSSTIEEARRILSVLQDEVTK